MCYYLTKIDTLKSIADLMKVSNQTTQVFLSIALSLDDHIESSVTCEEYSRLGFTDYLPHSGRTERRIGRSRE